MHRRHAGKGSVRSHNKRHSKTHKMNKVQPLRGGFRL